jgi:hypothetical protein
VTDNCAFSAAYDAPHMPPAEKQPCLCAHAWVWHQGFLGRCEVPGCGCRTFRTGSVK